MKGKSSYSVSSENSYSKALYELAVEGNSLNQIEEQVLAITKLISVNQDFNYLIKDPTIKKENQHKVISEISKKFNFNQLFIKFLNFLTIKRRLFYLEKILNDFLAICSKMRGEISAELIAAKNLNENDINDFLRQIRMALLEADVNFKVVKSLIESIKNETHDPEFSKSLNPGYLLVEILKQQLITILTSDNSELVKSNKKCSKILVVGIQGSGNTTTAA